MSKTNTPSLQSKSNQGFSLIETLVSLGVMAMMIIGLMVTQGGHVRMVDKSKKRTICTNLAEQALEERMGISYSELEQEIGEHSEGYGDIPNYPEYRRVTRIRTLSTDLITVQVEVFWREMDVLDKNSKPLGLPSVLWGLRTRTPEKEM